jgi:aminoglycoside phosphotransferase (APT) family kinase protein
MTLKTAPDCDTTWIEATVGPILEMGRHPAAGRSRGIWMITVAEAGRPVQAILRAEVGLGPWSGTPFTLAREARTLAALRRAGVKVPRVLGIAPDHSAMVQTRLRGRTGTGYVDEAERISVMRSFLAELARLHALDPHELNLPVPVPATPTEHALLDLADYVSAYRELCEPHPEFEETVAWLAEQAPQAVSRTSVVHGDAGPGNFAFEAGQLTGFLDLEMSHISEPEDDLAWLWLRTRLLGDDPHFDEYLADYERLAGRRLDRNRIDYYCIFVITRCAAANLYVNAHGITGPRAGLERVLTWLRGAQQQIGAPARPGAAEIAPLPGAGQGR